MTLKKRSLIYFDESFAGAVPPKTVAEVEEVEDTLVVTDPLDLWQLRTNGLRLLSYFIISP